jgi:hypothetical protein
MLFEKFYAQEEQIFQKDFLGMQELHENSC